MEAPCVMHVCHADPQPVGPHSLQDIKAGKDTDGDTGHSPLQMPPWLDMERYLRVRRFFMENAMSLVLAWHCSLVIGFSLPPLLAALVFTHASDTAKESLERYARTFAHLARWHTGNIFDPASEAFKSVNQVRSLHAGVRHKMETKMPGFKAITMYDMATVQTGFMGAITRYSTRFGIFSRQAQLEDYIYFWKCVGYQLGIDDKYNLCSLGKEVSDEIVTEIINEVLMPAIHNPPTDYGRISQAYIDGMNMMFMGIPLFSVKSTLAVTYWAMGLPWRGLSCLDTCRFYYLRLLLLMAGFMPVMSRFMNWSAARTGLQLPLPPASAAGGRCPFTGRSSSAGGGCPIQPSASSSRECAHYPEVGDSNLPTCTCMAFAMLLPLLLLLLILSACMLFFGIFTTCLLVDEVMPLVHQIEHSHAHWSSGTRMVFS
eukprot:TRINITY_DN47153_c0_g1_i1.p1 TRINITY_DN47153_c0_g1~~TRINITY_DN47153_c0_g1_i1.p1  ORF type:complete len:429 (+),score=63.16 TRINITY_DN47153_c0_g1_i1:72-1358(+)